MTELEIELTRLMIQLIMRYPDGLERIQSAFLSVLEGGIDLAEATTVDPNNWIH